MVKTIFAFWCRLKPSQDGGNINGHGKDGKFLGRASKGT